MDRNTAAALGQNLSNAFSDIGQIFDPRVRAAADQQRLTVEGLRLKNTGQGIENDYAPKVLTSQIGLNNARAATEGTQQGLYKSQTEFQDTRNKGLSDLYKFNAPAQTSLTPLQQKIASAAATYNVDPNIALSIVGQESGFNPNTTPGTSSASGLFQFLDNDRKQYGVPANAPEDQQIDAGMRKMQENYNAAEKALGRKPTAGEAYAVYYQGIGAGPKILQNPDASFRDTLSQFGTGYADSVIKANPWLADIKTNRDFINWSEQKMGKQGFTGQSQPVDMNRSAILSSVAGGGGDPSQLINALAKVQGMGATDELTARQAALGQGVVMNQGEYFLPQESTAYQNRALTSAFKINEADNQSNQLIKSAEIIADSAGGDSGSTGTRGTKPQTLSPNEMSDIKSIFATPDEDGNLVLSPEMRTISDNYAVTVESLLQRKVPVNTAIAYANRIHGIDQITTEDPWFGAPRKVIGKNARQTAITPQEADAYATPYNGGVANSNDARLAAAAILNPSIAEALRAPVTGVEQPAQQAPQNNPPPMLQRPVEQPAPPARASDEFKRREGSAEKKARLRKEKEIASLEADIKETLNTLKTGSVDTSGVGMRMGGAFAAQPQTVKLSDDGYNRTLDRLKEMEAKLEKLKGGSDQSGQSDIGSRYSLVQ